MEKKDRAYLRNAKRMLERLSPETKDSLDLSQVTTVDELIATLDAAEG